MTTWEGALFLLHQRFARPHNFPPSFPNSVLLAGHSAMITLFYHSFQTFWKYTSAEMAQYS